MIIYITLFFVCGFTCGLRFSLEYFYQWKVSLTMHHSFLSISLLCSMCMFTITNACSSSQSSSVEIHECNEDSVDEVATEYHMENGEQETTDPIIALPEVCYSTTTPYTTTASPTTTTTVPQTTTVENCKDVPCGDGFEEHQGKCYKFIPAAKVPGSLRQPSQFESECRNQKARLTFLYDQATVDFFVGLVRRGRRTYGMVDSHKSTNSHLVREGTVVLGIIGDQEREFRFEDDTGVPPEVLQWAAFQPRSGAGEKSRVTMAVGIEHIKDGHLLVWPNSAVFTGAICERPHPSCPDEHQNDVRPRCEIPPQGEGRCEDDWKLHAASATCYKKIGTILTSEKLEKKCNEMGAHLPAIHFEEQANFIRGMAQIFFWVGVRSEPNNTIRYDRYLDGSAMDYGNNWEQYGEVEYDFDYRAPTCVFELPNKKSSPPTYMLSFFRCDSKNPMGICAKPAEGIVFKPPGCVFLGKVMP